MDNQSINNLAEKIAFLLQTEMQKADDGVKLNLEKINRRLDNIESKNIDNPKFKIQNPKSSHFSQQQFTNLEELADEIIAGVEAENACPYEPAGKPCDHCAMCNSRGF